MKAVAEHVHRWLIATPDGETCAARCRCGKERWFNAGFRDKGWRGCKRCGHDYKSSQHKDRCLRG